SARIAVDARPGRQGIAQVREPAAGWRVGQDAEVTRVEQATLPEGADPPVDTVRLVQVEGGAAEVVEQIAEARAGERGEQQIQLMVAQQVAEDEDGALRRPEARRHDRVARGEIEAVLAL